MRCHQCNEYIPENLGIKNCVKCGAELSEELAAKVEKVSITQTEQVLETKHETLTKEQEIFVEERLEKVTNSVLTVCAIWVIMVAATMIPIKFIPTRRAQAIQGATANQSVVETLGITTTVIFLLIFAILFYVIVIHHSRFFSLKKDLKERKTITIASKIVDIVELKGDKEKEYAVYLDKNTENLKKINYLKSEFPNIREGDIIKVTLTKNAHLVMSTELVSKKS